MGTRVDQAGACRVLVVDRKARPDDPVLLFLHGRGEASTTLDELPRVFRHLSPPLQALVGNLGDVTVLAPQAPYDPGSQPGWDWGPHIEELARYLASSDVGERPLLACGFSRGGRGTLQLLEVLSDRIQRWALVDPQKGPSIPPSRLRGSRDATGWLTYGPGNPKIWTFSSGLAKQLHERNVVVSKDGHAELARKSFFGDANLEETGLYAFLGLRFRRVVGLKPGAKR